MKNVKVNKEQLLSTLQKNQQTHEADFEIAWSAYREKALENLTKIVDSLKNMKEPQQVDLWINLDCPQNHKADYQRAIEMLDWEIGDEVVLTELEFQQFVQDNWSWKGKFSMDNKLYTGSASPSSVEIYR